MGAASQARGASFEKAVFDLAGLCGWRIASFRGVRIQRRNGSFYYSTPVQRHGKGWPDAVLVRGSVILFRELKAGSGRRSRAQVDWHERLEAAGCDVAVWRDTDWPTIERELARDLDH